MEQQQTQSSFSQNLSQLVQKLHQTLPQGQNLFYSPINIQTALSMTYAGASGATQSEMKQILFPTFQNDDHLHTEFFKASQTLSKQSTVQLQQANKIWPAQGEALLPNYISQLEKHYNTTVKPVDFAGATELSRQEINKWVEEQTKEKIKDLLAPGVIDASTRLVLTSAIYFKGNWKNKFDSKKTIQYDFCISKDQKIKVPIMNQTEKFPYFKNTENKFSALEMPYKGDQFSMGFVLPDENESLDNIKTFLFSDQNSFQNIFSKLSEVKVIVGVPKFKFEFKTSLKESLQKIGVNNAFGPEADFSGMNGNKTLFISDVIHQAFIEVNEEGAEAAAATAVTLSRCAVRHPIFMLNRPFLFYIKENSTNSILFFGQYSSPK